MNTEELSVLEQYLWPKGSGRDVWMIVDTARDRRIYSMLLECHLEYSCLYSGALSPALKLAAPYLIQLSYGYSDTQRFLRRAWANSWGVFIKCDTGLNQLRRHLRRFLIVHGPDGNHLMFRYYDPRVLRAYLPTCTSEELRLVFGPIECFWMENETADAIFEFGFNKRDLMRKELPVRRREKPEVR